MCLYSTTSQVPVLTDLDIILWVWEWCVYMKATSRSQEKVPSVVVVWVWGQPKKKAGYHCAKHFSWGYVIFLLWWTHTFPSLLSGGHIYASLLLGSGPPLKLVIHFQGTLGIGTPIFGKCEEYIYCLVQPQVSQLYLYCFRCFAGRGLESLKNLSWL